MTERTLSPSTQAILDRYQAVQGRLAGHDLPWLAKLRDDAARAFRATGFPTTRVEEWKYTSLKALEDMDFAAGVDAPADDVDLPDPLVGGPRLVFVDGVFRADLSNAKTGKGVRVSNLATDLVDHVGLVAPRLSDNGERTPLLTLNGALADDGYVIELDDGAVVGDTVEILFWDSGRAAVTQPRNIVAAGANSRLTLLEHHAGGDTGKLFFNGATMITAAPGARVTHYRIQGQAAGTVHVNTIRARIEKDARYDSFILADGGAVARDEMQVMLAADGAATSLRGVYLPGGDQVIDNTLSVRHAAPRTTSTEFYKGAIDGSARAVFQGGIHVERGADGTDGRMTNKSLLLSDKAEIDTKPQLEIFADDVKCSHGATAGELDADSLFYLRSRGIAEGEARGMLVEAFLDEVIDQATDRAMDEALAVHLRDRVASFLGRPAATNAEAA